MLERLGLERIKALLARHRVKLLVGQAVIFVLIGLVLAWSFGGTSGSPPSAANEHDGAHQVSEGPSMWTCSMHPQIRSGKPGKCPICGMDLIPVAKTSGGMRTLTVSPEARALMSVETSPVERKYVAHEIPMVGKVDYDETNFGYITAWVPGRLDRLFVDYTGVDVKKGDHTVSIYSPELYSTQDELIQALKFRRDNQSTRFGAEINLVESAREKLRLLGLTEEQIKEIEKQDKPTDHMTIYSPVSGIVIEKLKQVGDYVRTGERIYTVADLNLVWVHLDAYESDLSWIRYGQDVTITTEAYPGDKFHGRIAFIQPVLNDKTRTVKVRVNVPNSDGKLKPEMFVHAVVRPKVAAGGRVMDPSLAGKWISPMHPEIVKDEPGNCDVCGMPLVRTESLGYVAPETDEKQRPLVIPYSAALVTGTRAVVYVELPAMHSVAEPAFQTLSAIVQDGDLEKIREASATYANMLDRPYDQPGTGYAKTLWNQYADRLGWYALAGQRARRANEAEQAFAGIETTMNWLREQFAPSGQPTFEGREIVLGPRAGDYLLVRSGLQEGELVVTQGNFKIDSEIQIQAKPSMMTPEGGGGGGGHDHGDGGGKRPAGGEHAGHAAAATSLPPEVGQQLHDLYAAYDEITKIVKQGDLPAINAAFNEFGNRLAAVDGNQLTGHPRMLWKEFSMLLGNDVVEGRDAQQLADADRVYLLLKGHMRRLRDQLGISPDDQPAVKRIAVAPEFQTQLAGVWQQYLLIQQALAADNGADAHQLLSSLESTLANLDDKSLTGRVRQIWAKERASLTNLIGRLRKAEDLNALRAEFHPFSQEIGVLAKAFGFGETRPVYELHCSMAFQGKGGVWYQASDEVRNPYYGSTMLGCANRVEQIMPDEPAMPDEHNSHQDHSQH